MVGVFALFVTIGAILTHIGHFDIGIISLILGLILFISIVISTLHLVDKKLFYYVAFAILGIVVGIVCTWFATPTDTPSFGKKDFVTVIDSVDKRISKTNYQITYNDNSFLVTTIDENFLPGDSVRIQGLIEKPANFITSTGRLFDYQDFLLARNISGIIHNPSMTLVAQGSTSLNRFTTELRFKINQLFVDNIHFPYDGIVSGMVIGYQGGLTDQIKTLFKNTGTLHALVLSGYNVTLLATILAFIFSKLPFKLRTILSIVAIIFLVFLSGAGISALRAGMTGSLALVANLFTRTYDPWRALILAYLILFFLSPFSIFYDPGFQLSFLASFFMINLLPKLQKLFIFIPETKFVSLREMSILAFVLPLFMLPYTMYFSGIIGLGTPGANTAIALLVPIITILGIGILVVSFVTPVTVLIGFITSGIVAVLVKILEFFALLPIWNLPAINPALVVGIYLSIIGIFFKKEILRYIWIMKGEILRSSNQAAS